VELLIIGGTKFLGRALVDVALARDHEVTLFNRGKTNPDLYPDVEKLIGDRREDLSALEGRTWDAVIDTCGYIPREVEMSARLLADHVEHYTFISSISVYDESVLSMENPNEDAPLATLEDETVEEITHGSYGGLKVLCEQTAEAAMLGRALNVRSGLIVGPYDPTDRFTYWPVSVAQRDRVLAPPENAGIQFIDVRDLAEWTVMMAEGRKAGNYNATGPDERLTYGEVLNVCRAAVGAGEVVHVSEDFLLENELQPWVDLPLWLPEHMGGLSRVNVDKALADGLTFRPVETTVRDLLTWYEAHHEGELQAGLSAERNAELLKFWDAQT